MTTQTKPAPTAEQLNAIQAEWMALDSNAPDAEKRRVFALMEAYPRNQVSASADLKRGAPMCDGMPVWADARTLQEALDFIRLMPSARTDVVWVGSVGKWVAVPL